MTKQTSTTENQDQNIAPRAMERSPFRFTGPHAKEVKNILQKYPQGRQHSAVLALLDLAQRQNTATNCLTPDALATIAEMLDMPEIRVYEIATFYSMFRLKPTGKYHVQVCGTVPCMLCNAEGIKATILNALGVKEGETTEDGLFTVTEVECLGACVNAPIVQINDSFCHNMTNEDALALINDLKEGKTTKMQTYMNRPALPLGYDGQSNGTSNNTNVTSKQ